MNFLAMIPAWLTWKPKPKPKPKFVKGDPRTKAIAAAGNQASRQTFQRRRGAK